MARRFLEFGAILFIISIFSIFIVVLGHLSLRFVAYVEYHEWNTLTDFFTDFLFWPLESTDVWYRYLVFLGWLAFFLGILFIIGSGLRTVIGRLFRKSLLIEVPEHPEYRNIGQKVVAVIPAFNEEQSICSVIEKTRKYVDQIVVVNDGSDDRTGELALDMGAHVITHIVRSGLGPTMRNGLEKALALNADIIITIDADGQYVEDEIPNIIYPIAHGEADFVLGSRIAGHIEKMPIIKKFGNRVLSWAVGVITGYGFSDTQTGFRAMNSKVAESLRLKGEYTYTQEMVLQIAKTTFNIAEVPITFRKREYGESRLIDSPTSYAVRTLAIILRTLRDNNPLTFFGSVGFLLMAVGGYIAGNSAIRWSQKLPIDASTVILAFLFFSVGLQILFFGFVADMLKRDKHQLVDITRYEKKDELIGIIKEEHQTATDELSSDKD